VTFCAQYGNNNAYYGNIMLGSYYPPRAVNVQVFGGWPDNIPRNSPMVNNYPLPKDELPTVNEQHNHIAIIKRLRAELEATEDAQLRQAIRAEIASARAAKENAFKLAARAARLEDDDDSFMLLH
jgi:hypothetical protein